MIRKILAATDFSETSLNAIESAISVAVCNNAMLQILHVNDTMPGIEETYSIKEVKAFCDDLTNNILLNHGIKVGIIVAEGIVGQTIVKTVIENNVDLIIMGSHGISGTRELFIGSNSYYVIKRATCPVLLIPGGRKWTEFNKILFPVRPSLFSFKLYGFITFLVKQKKEICNVKIFGISSDQFQQETEMLSALALEAKNKYPNNKIEVAVGTCKNRNIAEGVLTKAKQLQADLVIISPGIDVPARPLFIGPFSQRIINHSKTPILSLLRIS